MKIRCTPESESVSIGDVVFLSGSHGFAAPSEIGVSWIPPRNRWISSPKRIPAELWARIRNPSPRCVPGGVWGTAFPKSMMRCHGSPPSNVDHVSMVRARWLASPEGSETYWPVAGSRLVPVVHCRIKNQSPSDSRGPVMKGAVGPAHTVIRAAVIKTIPCEPTHPGLVGR